MKVAKAISMPTTPQFNIFRWYPLCFPFFVNIFFFFGFCELASITHRNRNRHRTVRPFHRSHTKHKFSSFLFFCDSSVDRNSLDTPLSSRVGTPPQPYRFWVPPFPPKSETPTSELNNMTPSVLRLRQNFIFGFRIRDEKKKCSTDGRFHSC